MALKGPRTVIDTDISFACESVAERGTVLVHKSGASGSGVTLGDSAGTVQLASNPSGLKVAGLLLNDVVSIDETRYHRNRHKDEMKTGERCNLLLKGSVVTNNITGTPAVNDTAYLTSNGVLTPTVSSTGGTTATPKVGQFKSIKDENGYVRVDINLPQI